MIFHKHIPQPPLSYYVDCIVYVEGNNKGTGFPKTAMSLVFNLNDGFKLFSGTGFNSFTEYKKYWVAGFQTQPVCVESYGESKMLVVQFKTLGAGVFLSEPLREFTNRFITLDCVFNNEAEETWERIHTATAIDDKIGVAENFLRRKMLAVKAPALKLPACVQALYNTGGRQPVEDICRRLNVSRKHLNFLFGEYLGVSPKMLASLSRFQRILHTISKSGYESLTSIAYELDFFDQAHFNNQFKKFTGLTPGAYIRTAQTSPALRMIPHFLPAP